MMPPVAAVSIEGLRVSYGPTEVVKGLDLAVAPGEVVSLLGPSGCGKTTTLRAIGGFAAPVAGAIRLHGADVTGVPAARRNIGFVFQGYALFPHLSVFDNVAYGLRMRGVARAAIAERVRRALDLVKLGEFAERRPKALSGGQQQRVAIARALVIEPTVMLLDEPLSNLYAKLRQEMRVELRRLLKQMNIASIFVTHDQEEAIVISDRIVLMNEGRVEQDGTPRDLYYRPANLFVAAFLGQANFLPVTVTRLAADGLAVVAAGRHELVARAADGLRPGMAATLVVKSERVGLWQGEAAATNRVECRFEAASFLGPSVQLQCDLDGRRLNGLVAASAETPVAFERGQPVTLGWRHADGLVFPGGP
jgi:putative spermidine/putrescine transport system ATP-binding protein